MIGFYDYTVILTYISFASSISGIFLATRGHFNWAIFCLAFSGLCDMFDGKIARTKKNRTEDEKRFGIQIDSLCDVVCFGVFPIVLCYELGMTHFYSIPILIFYGLAGVIRLGYFNVMEEKRQNETSANRKYYQGLPITSMSVALPLLFVFAPLCRGYFLICAPRTSDLEGRKNDLRLCAYPYRKQGKNHPKLDLIREENDLQDRFLHMMYSHAAGRAAMQPLVQSFVSRAAGCFLDSRLSVPLVAPFVKKNHISLKECTAKQFISFNDFFVRKLKMDARPFSNAPQDFISPCDARLTVYPIHENGKFEIKNTEYTLEQLLRDRKLAKRYEGGTLFLFRLSVDDYHRYLFVDDGVCSTERRIEGVLHTVNPAANDFCPIYKENTRTYTLLQSANFGTLLQMEVGAMMVGKIVNENAGAARRVQRGEEKGYFAFGGSTVIVLAQKGSAVPEKRIWNYSRLGIETRVRQGETVGTAGRTEL